MWNILINLQEWNNLFFQIYTLFTQANARDHLAVEKNRQAQI